MLPQVRSRAGYPVVDDFTSPDGTPIVVDTDTGRCYIYVGGSIVLIGDSSLSTFLQTGTGAVARTVQDRLRDTISVKDFGAACDDSTDDTAAIQAAIDSVGDTSVSSRAGPDVLIPGPCRITNTLVIRRKGLQLVGNGWGNRLDTGVRRSYLRWDGGAGSAMAQFSDCWAGAGMRRLKLMGKVGAAPSCAIELNETNDGVPNQNLTFDQVYIGPFSGETGFGVQFTDGFQWTGTKINNAEDRLLGCYINQCSGAGIRQNSIQSVNLKIDHITIAACGMGIYPTAQIEGSNWTFLNNGVDIYNPFDDGTSQVNTAIMCMNYYSEGAGRMFESLGVTKLTINGGQFQISSLLNADGKIIKAESNVPGKVVLNDFAFTQASAPPTAPLLSMRPPGGGAADIQLVLNGITGWANLTGGTTGLNIATRGGTDRRYIFFLEHAQAANAAPVRVAQNFLQAGLGADWDITRFDLPMQPTLLGVLFANVGTPLDGTVIYVTDGTAASNPLVGGGGGCVAVRQGGAWKGL